MPSRRTPGSELLILVGLLAGCPHERATGDPALSKCNVTLSPGQSIMAHAGKGVICLEAGVYPGGLFLEKSVEIRGTAGSVIDAGGKGAAVRVAADDVVAILS